jgi:hypothetical protein
MRDAGPSNLFHAIVGLGLAAVGCGGEILGQADDSGGPTSPDDALGAPSADVEDAQPEPESGETAGDAGTTDAGPDADSADAGMPFDAAMARDAARDVAREAWPPPPIK